MPFLWYHLQTPGQCQAAFNEVTNLQGDPHVQSVDTTQLSTAIRTSASVGTVLVVYRTGYNQPSFQPIGSIVDLLDLLDLTREVRARYIEGLRLELVPFQSNTVGLLDEWPEWCTTIGAVIYDRLDNYRAYRIYDVSFDSEILRIKLIEEGLYTECCTKRYRVYDLEAFLHKWAIVKPKTLWERLDD